MRQVQEPVYIAPNVRTSQKDAPEDAATNSGLDSVLNERWESGDARGRWVAVQFARNVSPWRTYYSRRSRHAI